MSEELIRRPNSYAAMLAARPRRDEEGGVMKTLVELIGWAVLVMFLCGWLGIGDFALCYGGEGKCHITKNGESK